MRFRNFLALVLVLLFSGLTLTACTIQPKGTSDTDSSTETEDDDDTGDDENDGADDEDEDIDNEEDEDNEDDDSSSATDFTNFTTNDQAVGTSSAGSEYTITRITDTAMTGFHRFEFFLQSTKTTLPRIEAELVSAEGYISVKLDRVTSDQSGISYQSSRAVDEEGVLSIYHAVTPVQTEEVYQIGIASDARFYLHAGTGLSVILDVKYPGEGEEPVAVTDPTTFTSGSQTLTGTNTVGDVKISAFSWAVEGGVVKFIWSTSSASGNATPSTTATYNAGPKTIVVTFGNVQTDLLAGSGPFETPLSGGVTKVAGTRSGTQSTYTFTLGVAATYRIYRNVSPNQVVIEIKP